jgi:hypothetical protein
MIKKIKRKIYNILYSLPFGMKGAEDEMLSQKSSLNTDNVGVHQVINENRLSKDLLKGEVTQQVEELRYRDYKVSRESKKYKYLGEGIAVKKDLIINSTRLIQENKLMVKTVSEELNRVDKETYAIDEYTLKIVYDSFPKFKLEKYCNYFEIVDNKLILRFETTPSVGKIDTYSFIKEIEYMFDNMSKENDYTKLNMVKFVTYNCIGEDDLIEYTLQDLRLNNIEKIDKEYRLTFSYNFIVRNDLTEKFYSKTMDEKYQNKEKKELVLDLSNQERVRYCSVCSKEMSVYDGDITEETYGYPICKECLEKTLLLKEE